MANTKITTNVIADDAVTSDKLGGDLTMPGHISLADNKEIRVGTGNDLVIKHTGSHANITNTTGNLTLRGDTVYIANGANSEYMAQFVADGAASLRFNNVEELATVSGGVYVPNKIGIGTNSASSELHVKGSGEVQVYIDAATNNNPGVRFLENGANKWTIGNDNTNDGFFFYDFGASAERMRIASNGNITINEALLVGTDVAYDKLAVLRTGTSQTGGMTLLNTQNGGYGSGITWESKRSDANNIQTAGRISVQGYNSWNSDSTSSSKMVFSVRHSNTLSDVMTIQGGNLVFNQAGKGISFENSGSGTGSSSVSHLLDDYEEGTWSPGIGEGAVSVGGARYTKIGNLVTVTANIYGFTNISSTNAVAVNNLPFAQTGSGSGVGGLIGRHMDKEVSPYVNGVSGNTVVNFYTCDSGGYTAINHSQLNSGSADFHFTISYRV